MQARRLPEKFGDGERSRARDAWTLMDDDMPGGGADDGDDVDDELSELVSQRLEVKANQMQASSLAERFAKLKTTEQVIVARGSEGIRAGSGAGGSAQTGSASSKASMSPRAAHPAGLHSGGASPSGGPGRPAAASAQPAEAPSAR